MLLMNTAKTPLVLGHRGYRARYPENTLLAFREAISAGADGVECDVQKTADGQYVVIHDDTTDRVTGSRGDVGRMSFDELRALDFGSGESIPLLDDFLALLPGDAYLDLELKEETLTVEDCGRIANILVARRNRTHLMISSFNAALLVPFRKTGFTVGYLVGDETMAAGAGSLARTLLRLRPQYMNLPVQMFDRLGARKAVSLLRLFRLCGCSLLFWTVNSSAEVARVWRFARIVVTDEVELILKERAARRST
jgi:glycerophosphoryl diester phosphodiesterase